MGKSGRYGWCRSYGKVLDYRNKQMHGYFSSMEIWKKSLNSEVFHFLKQKLDRESFIISLNWLINIKAILILQLNNQNQIVNKSKYKITNLSMKATPLVFFVRNAIKLFQKIGNWGFTRKGFMEKKYFCEICDYSCAQSLTLKRHHKSVHVNTGCMIFRLPLHVFMNDKKQQAFKLDKFKIPNK